MIGQTLVLGRDRRPAYNVVAKAPDGSVVNVRPPTRTNAQNAKMHAMLSDISRAKPNGRVMPPEKWKSVFMDAIGCKAEWVPSLDGENVVCTGYRSSKLTKSRMSDMIEQMYAFGAEQGVQWSEPASCDRSGEAGDTPKSESTEGESAVLSDSEGDAQTIPPSQESTSG